MKTDAFQGTGMCEERWQHLMNNPETNLTQGEIREGWSWSNAFDGLLVHRTWPEAKYDNETHEPA
jgi:hypothetical protein